MLKRTQNRYAKYPNLKVEKVKETVFRDRAVGSLTKDILGKNRIAANVCRQNRKKRIADLQTKARILKN